LDRLNWFGSLRWKFFLSFISVGLIPIMIFGFTTTNFIESYFISNKENDIKRKAAVITDTVIKGNFLTDSSKDKLNLLSVNMTDKSRAESFRILIIDDKGVVINDTNYTYNNTTFISPEIIHAMEDMKPYSKLQEDGMTLYTAVPMLNDDSTKAIGTVLIVSGVSDVFNLINSVKRSLMPLIGIITLVVFICVFFISHIIIGPLKNILRVVTLMSEGHLNQRIGVRGRDEFSQLAVAFNNMNDKLEQVEKTREEFVSNVSHELKTPLSSIKVLSESILFQENVPVEMYREFLQDINSEVDRMTFIVNDLLTLVKLDQRTIGLNIKPTEINKMVEDILKRLYPLAEQKKIELLYEDVKRVVIDADEMKLSLAISNLVENGIKYTPDGGTVKVIVDADHQNAFITVQDTGVGIAEEEQSKVFTRFYRIDKTRDRGTGGTGLGLSITHSTVLLHNGSIRLSSKEGEGTTFVVRLPIKHTS